MRVGVDGRSLDLALPGGIGVYLENVLERLATEAGEDRLRVLVPGRMAPRRPDTGTLEWCGTRLPGRLLFGAGALTGRPRADRLLGGCDVFWAPFPAPIGLSPGIPLVLTVHDLSWQHRASDLGAYDRLWHRLARPADLARRARCVIAVSDSVRDQALEAWDLDPNRLRTVRSGPGRRLATSGSLPPGVEPPYLLAVGALEGRKQPLLLQRAHSLAAERGLRAGLVFVGGGPLAGSLEAGGATVFGRLPQPALEALYTHALALVCPSADEGFGFTPLEALARGVPAVVSDLPVFAETVGGGALRFPSGDVEALAEALLRIEREPGTRERLVAAGGEAVRRLSWERTARETLAVLREAAAS